MRIAEIIENITSVGSLAPDAYDAVALQRNAAQRQQTAATQQARQRQQQATQQQLLAKRRAVKPKPLKWRKRRKSKTHKNS
jgi:hypothetical protein